LQASYNKKRFVIVLIYGYDKELVVKNIQIHPLLYHNPAVSRL
jgi:hypothetical protein